MLLTAIKQLLQQQELSAAALQAAMEEILTGDNPEQIAAFLVLLKQKGETTADIEALVRFMQSKMRSLDIDTPVLDIVGTGGDGFNTINISTASSVLAASCGVKIVKHGGRAGSSLTGSADLMEAFGYNLELSDSKIVELVATYNFAFCAAPKFHQSFAATKPIRKKLGIPTVFNFLGPLLNPASAEYMLLGVADKKYLQIMAETLQKLGIKHGLVFNCQGLDEICTVGNIDVVEVTPDELKTYQLNPADYGFNLCQVSDLQGGDAACNKQIVTEVLSGNRQDAITDTVIFNAGVANYIYGISSSVASGIIEARDKLASGAAYELLKQMVAVTNLGEG